MQTNVANTGMYELAVSDMQLVAGGGWGEALGYGALGVRSSAVLLVACWVV